MPPRRRFEFSHHPSSPGFVHLGGPLATLPVPLRTPSPDYPPLLPGAASPVSVVEPAGVPPAGTPAGGPTPEANPVATGPAARVPAGPDRATRNDAWPTGPTTPCSRTSPVGDTGQEGVHLLNVSSENVVQSS